MEESSSDYEKKVRQAFKLVFISRGCESKERIIAVWAACRRTMSLEQIMKAIPTVSMACRFVPNESHFHEALFMDNKDKVQKALDSIEEALKRFGYNNSGNARSFLGETLWASIGHAGGYQHLCRHFDRKNTTFVSQLRDRLSSNIQNPEKFQDLLSSNKDMSNLITTTLNKLGGSNE